MSKKDNNKIDVMCTHTMDGKIIPMKIRLKDEDNLYRYNEDIYVGLIKCVL